MQDVKMAVWRVPAGQLIPPMAGAATVNDINFATLPELAAIQEGDWIPVSHQLLGVDGGDVVLSVMLVREVAVSDDLSGLTDR